MNSILLPLHLQSPGIWVLLPLSVSQPHSLTRPTQPPGKHFPRWPARNNHLHKPQQDFHGGLPLTTPSLNIPPLHTDQPVRCRHITGSFSIIFTALIISQITLCLHLLLFSFCLSPTDYKFHRSQGLSFLLTALYPGSKHCLEHNKASQNTC